MIAALLVLLSLLGILDPLLVARRCNFVVRCVDSGDNEAVCFGKRSCG